MKKLPQRKRVEFYKWLCAYTFFEQAHKIMEGIIRLPPNTPDWHRNALWTSFFVTYAKPFKQRSASKKLEHSIRLDPDTFVPAEALDGHKELIKARDKMFAHTDYSDHPDENGVQMSGVFAAVNARNELRFGIRSRIPPADTMEAIFALSKVLRDRAESEYLKLWSLYSPYCPLMTGCWDVNIEKSSNDLFVPIKLTTVPLHGEFPQPG